MVDVERIDEMDCTFPTTLHYYVILRRASDEARQAKIRQQSHYHVDNGFCYVGYGFSPHRVA